MHAQSPLAKYHLVRNPFGELTVRERVELAVVELDEHLQWLKHSDRAVLQFVGECGRGKSTNLRALQAALGEQVAMVYFPEVEVSGVLARAASWWSSQPSLPANRPLVVDEAQRMSWWRRRQLLRGAGPLVIGTHLELTSDLKSAGFVVRTIDLNQPIAPDRLQSLLNRRILASVSGVNVASMEHHPLCLSLKQVVVLQQQFGSNIREIEHYLYELLQRFAEKGEPWLPVN